MSEPQTSPSARKRSKPLKSDEWLALVLAFGALGLVAFYSLTRSDRDGAFAFLSSVERLDGQDAERQPDADADRRAETDSESGSESGTGTAILIGGDSLTEDDSTGITPPVADTVNVELRGLGTSAFVGSASIAISSVGTETNRSASPSTSGRVDRPVAGGDPAADSGQSDTPDGEISPEEAALLESDASDPEAADGDGDAAIETPDTEKETDNDENRDSLDSGEAEEAEGAENSEETAESELDAKPSSDTSASDTREDDAPLIEEGSATVSAEIAETGPELVFTDLPDDRWSKPFIDGLSKRGLISGFPDGTFGPGQGVTRAELAAQIQSVFDREESLRETLPFSDVSETYWGSVAIDKAVEIGFMSGYPDETFAPDKPVSRLEVAVALATGLGLRPSATPADILEVFPDAETIPTWAEPKIAAATQAGLIVVDPETGEFGADLPATREVVATMVYQALVGAAQAEAIESDRLVLP